MKKTKEGLQTILKRCANWSISSGIFFNGEIDGLLKSQIKKVKEELNELNFCYTNSFINNDKLDIVNKENIEDAQDSIGDILISYNSLMVLIYLKTAFYRSKNRKKKLINFLTKENVKAYGQSYYFNIVYTEKIKKSINFIKNMPYIKSKMLDTIDCQYKLIITCHNRLINNLRKLSLCLIDKEKKIDDSSSILMLYSISEDIGHLIHLVNLYYGLNHSLASYAYNAYTEIKDRKYVDNITRKD